MEIIQLNTPPPSEWKFSQPLVVQSIPQLSKTQNCIFMSCNLSDHNMEIGFQLLEYVSDEVKKHKITQASLFIDLDYPIYLFLKIDQDTKFLVKRYHNEKPKIDVYNNYNFIRKDMKIKVGFRGLFLEKNVLPSGKVIGNINIHLDYILGLPLV